MKVVGNLEWEEMLRPKAVRVERKEGKEGGNLDNN